MKWNITKDDVAASQLVEAGWHPTEVIDFEIAKSKDGESMNAIYTMRIFAGKFEGTRTVVYFSEKLPVMMTPLLKALGYEPNTEGGYSVDISKETMVGKKFLAHYVRGSFNNKPKNEIDEYAPAG